jgi:NAD(P)-dependent dehydrogenase (short-subunit alcohol dehydrogenase family)
MGKLDGQVAIVTGGGTGIGYETAKMLAAEGAQVVVAGRRREPLDAVVAEIKRAGGQAFARRADMENSRDPLALARWTLERFGHVDILINNAGHSSRVRSIRWVSKEDWDSVLAVNLTGVYLLTQAVLPSMIERGGGTVITVSSVAGIRPGLLGGAAYGAAKAGVRNLMGSLHAELRDKGIRATTILPAEVDTPILAYRPLVPDAKARATMMQAEDVAQTIMLCVLLPARTAIEEIVMNPTIPRDTSADVKAARMLGAPGSLPPAPHARRRRRGH